MENNLLRFFYDDLRWLEAHYRSTACQHKLHDKCRLTCKYCEARCLCKCHEENPND